ncbi:MAG TPA: efflux RND transporter periplasmic adaptor subunit [Myxococcaceae bacterium]|nr:efflux RND transporter periplasmic adaptor subunit [Myxococcaceae bacterium]
MSSTVFASTTSVLHGRRAFAVIVGGAAIAALFLVGYVPRHRAQKALAAATASAVTNAPSVQVIHPKVEGNVRTFALPGNIQALEATAVYARATGYVRRWLVDIGDKVTEGQLLAELDTPDLDQQLQQAREMLGQTKASLEQASANAKYATVTAKRYRALAAEQAVSQQEVDQTASQAAVGVANVHAAQAAIGAQTATVRQLEDLKAFARVTAPFAGTITARNIERGTLVTPGSASGRPLYMIAISNPLRVFVQVPQPFVSGIQVGAPVKVRVRQYPGRDFAGKITRFSGALDPATRTLTVEAQVANDTGELFPGGYADVTLSAIVAHNVSVIPVSALVLDAQGTRVATVDASSKVHFIPVQVGRDEGQSLEIVDGVTGEENVISTPTAGLAEGMMVKVSPTTATATPAK